METSLNETSTYSCDLQVGEFVFDKVDVTASASRSIFFLRWNLWNQKCNEYRPET